MKTGEEDSQAYVTVIDGKIVLIDPIGYTIIQAVNKSNCKNTYVDQMDRILHFKNRITEKELDPNSFVIVIINVDSLYGFEVAEALMPGHDWQQYRDRGEVPLSRGLIMKEGMVEVIAFFDKEASEKITQIEGVPVVIMDHNVVEIFSV